MRISFGVIVFNGGALLAPCLRAVYAAAHEILVVEGVVEAAAHLARDGHSTDDTRDVLASFPDPERKLRVITRDGPWPHKTAMSNAWLEQATGELVWQLDSDEFYAAETLAAVPRAFAEDPALRVVAFRQHNFFGTFDRVVRGGPNEEPCLRVFRREPGVRFVAHRPPTLYTHGESFWELGRLEPEETARRGWHFLHASYVSLRQVIGKVPVYGAFGWERARGNRFEAWVHDELLASGHALRKNLDTRYACWLEPAAVQWPPALRAELEAALRGDMVDPAVHRALVAEWPQHKRAGERHNRAFAARRLLRQRGGRALVRAVSRGEAPVSALWRLPGHLFARAVPEKRQLTGNDRFENLVRVALVHASACGPSRDAALALALALYARGIAATLFTPEGGAHPLLARLPLRGETAPSGWDASVLHLLGPVELAALAARPSRQRIVRTPLGCALVDAAGGAPRPLADPAVFSPALRSAGRARLGVGSQRVLAVLGVYDGVARDATLTLALDGASASAVIALPHAPGSASARAELLAAADAALVPASGGCSALVSEALACGVRVDGQVTQGTIEDWLALYSAAL